ncbi:MAG TPA: PTS sugar transporter subunit IIA [Candidatus Hydrogenedens sp.]|nr:PTS sugar transporter subunit IIA [Candidatus Hydrogenedens sp.]HOK09755.1 PTS sugar transporter subunit IIA [Candidatus Hydrogenedens sp.]HOL19566.1 PTS sugar transporter subunit IIA [Candidatus Hydrogenedens sp.]HPP58199.1 PTS sugar transporter subunit IIA [Candidatus Hydrogenedens sp.]
MIDLTKYITRDLVCVYKDAETKPFILEKIAKLTSHHNEELLSREKEVLDTFLEREQLGSTALTKGIALPHCRMSGISDFIIGILVSPEGVAYGSMDGLKSRIFFFVIAPKESGKEYLDIMAEIGSFLSNEEVVEKLMNSENDEFLFNTFLNLWDEYSHKEHNKE